VRKRRLKRGRADPGLRAKQKKVAFLPGEVFFPLTCPLMGDRFVFSKGNLSRRQVINLSGKHWG